MYLAPVHTPRVPHCDCKQWMSPYTLSPVPKCCICHKQPCPRGLTRMWRHLTAQWIAELSPTVLTEMPF